MIDIPFTVQEIVEATKETVKVNGLPSCYIRPIVYLGYGEMGLNPLPVLGQRLDRGVAVGRVPR
jgi:branched-chain amino acid aminotransferase